MHTYRLTHRGSPRWIAICLLNLCLIAPTQAAFVSVENFNDLSIGGLNGQGGWSAVSVGVGSTNVILDPAGGPNQVGEFFGDSDANNNSDFSSSAIADGTTGTLFFRMRIDDAVDSNISFGLSSAVDPALNSFNDFNSQLLWNSSGFGIREGATNLNFDQTLVADTWYDVWVVVDNSANTSSLFVQGGTFLSQTQLTSGGGSENSWDYRSTGADGNLQTFMVRGGFTNPDALFLDDIYMDNAGQNLVNPIPEPTSSVLAIAGASLLLLRRGRSKKAVV